MNIFWKRELLKFAGPIIKNGHSLNLYFYTFKRLVPTAEVVQLS
jgi:hypothetical protein